MNARCIPSIIVGLPIMIYSVVNIPLRIEALHLVAIDKRFVDHPRAQVTGRAFRRVIHDILKIPRRIVDPCPLFAPTACGRHAQSNGLSLIEHLGEEHVAFPRPTEHERKTKASLTEGLGERSGSIGKLWVPQRGSTVA